MTKTPEQMAEEFSDFFKGERRKTIAKKSWHTGFEEALKQQRIKMAELYSHGSDVQQIAAKYVKQRGTTGPMAAYEENRFIDGYLAAMNSPEKLDSWNSSNNSNGWISVKERLPEIPDNNYSNPVLLFRADGFIVIARIEKCVRFVRPLEQALIVETDNGDPIEEFTYWQPLPKPPEDK